MRRAGFTLIEVLAVVALMGLVFLVAVNFYSDLSFASRRALETTRDQRRATALLDRVARDLEGTLLVTKPAEADPLTHPWIFLGESRYAARGADQVKFVTRSYSPRRSKAHESDLSLVAYALQRGLDDGFELWRWSSPRLPDSLDRNIPSSEEAGAVLLAEGVASFSLTFLADTGEETDTWDSSTVLRSGQLPVAVDIQVAMVGGESDFAQENPRPVRRRVVLPMRPLDFAQLLDPEAAAALGGATETPEGEAGSEDSGFGGSSAGASILGEPTGETFESEFKVGDCINFSQIREPIIKQVLPQISQQNWGRWANQIRKVPDLWSATRSKCK